MKAWRSVLLAWTIPAMVCGVTLAQDAPLPSALTRALLQAKTAYVVSGHVRYFKTKAFVKTQMVDETPFEEPCRNELEKWGRFKVVSDVKDADLIVRAYMTGNTRSVPVMTAGVTGNVNVGGTFIVLDVLQSSSGKVLWSASKNSARSWSTKTALAGLVKALREHLQEEEKSGLGLN
jgi:hypothetical protein